MAQQSNEGIWGEVPEGTVSGQRLKKPKIWDYWTEEDDLLVINGHFKEGGTSTPYELQQKLPNHTATAIERHYRDLCNKELSIHQLQKLRHLWVQ